MKYNSAKAVGSIFTSIAQLVETEYVVGYYPQRAGDEPTTRLVEVRLKDKKIGTLYGGQRMIVH